MITHDPATDANVHKSTFAIDGFSRVALSTEFNWNGSKWVQVAQKHYVYDGMDPYVELGDRVNDIEKILLRGGNGEILSEPLKSTVVEQQDRYFYYDGSGNVSDVMERFSAVTPTVLGHYDYDAYGNLTGSSGSDPNANYYRYSGKEYIPSVGMYNYGYRFYSPGTGRWINRDPIGENSGLNVYNAFANSPTNYIDEYGETPVLLLLAAGGAVLSGYGNIISQEYHNYKNGKPLTNIDGGDVAIASSVGAASGLLSPGVTTVAGAGALGAVANATQYGASQIAHNRSPFDKGFVYSAAIGAGGGVIAGKFTAPSGTLYQTGGKYLTGGASNAARSTINSRILIPQIFSPNNVARGAGSTITSNLNIPPILRNPPKSSNSKVACKSSHGKK